MTVSIANIIQNTEESYSDSSAYSPYLGGPAEQKSDNHGLQASFHYVNSSGEETSIMSEETEEYFGVQTNAKKDKDTSSGKVLAAEHSQQGYVEGEENRTIRAYTTKKEESLESISEKFDISKETIAITNNIEDLDASIDEGETLDILPTDGVIARINQENSLEDIAENYEVDTETIRQYNDLSDNDYTSIIVPEATVPNEEKPFYEEPKVQVASTTRSYTPNQVPNTVPDVDPGYFGYPTTGRNFGVLHATNGIDVANTIGTPIRASAEGTVILSQDGWNGGYGSYIKVRHPNGVITLYAHLNRRHVQVGDTVTKGQHIGNMGSTGRSTGPHLHFEVRGAANPLAR